MTKKAIKASEFEQLSQELQIDLLQKDGSYAGKRIVNGKTYILFQLNSFYVEVQYKLYRKDVDRIIISDNPELLNPYLDQINVKDLDSKKGPESGL